MMIVHKRLIFRLLQIAIHAKADCQIKVSNRDYTGKIEADHDSGLYMTLLSQSDSWNKGEHLDITFQCEGERYTFESTVIDRTDLLTYLISIPTCVRKLTRRSCPRFKPQEAYPLFFFFQHPVHAYKKVVSRVQDLNTFGLRCSVENSDSYLLEGISIPSAHLNLPFDKTIEVDICLRHSMKLGLTHEYGVSFEHIQLEDQEKIFRYYLSLFFSQMRYRWEYPFEKIWGLFEASGYLSEKEGCFFSEIKENARKAWGHMKGGSFELSNDLVSEKNGEPVGTISATRIYEKSWMFHHLALTPDALPGGQILADIYFAGVIDFALHNRDIDFFIAYYNSEKNWHKKFFDGFYDMIGLSRKISVDEFDHYETLLPSEPFVFPDPCWSLSPPTREEGNLIFLELKKYLSPLVQEACSITPSEFHLPKTEEIYQRKGLHRERKIVALRKDGEMVAFALVESGSSGVNIFNLLDAAQLYYLREIPQIQLLLLKGVCNYYHSLGKKSFVLLVQNEDPEPYKMLGFKKICRLKRITFHRDLFSEYRTYLSLWFSGIKSKKHLATVVPP